MARRARLRPRIPLQRLRNKLSTPLASPLRRQCTETTHDAVPEQLHAMVPSRHAGHSVDADLATAHQQARGEGQASQYCEYLENQKVRRAKKM